MITRKSGLSQFKYTQKIRFRNLQPGHITKCILLTSRDIIFLILPRILKVAFVWNRQVKENLDELKGKSSNQTVLHLCTSLEIGGAQIALSSLVKDEIYRKRYRNCVIAFGKHSPLVDDIRENGTTVLNFRIIGPFTALMAFFFTLIFVGQLRPHKLYSWLYHTHLITILSYFIHPSMNIFWAVHSWKREYFSKTTKIVSWLCGIFSRLVPTKIIYASEASRLSHWVEMIKLSELEIYILGLKIQHHNLRFARVTALPTFHPLEHWGLLHITSKHFQNSYRWT